ncbi:MAG TPA: hypothetical protein VH083_05895 [Myxococcales bacterium]|jgi:hypothetical protein|nr:hypothetical protein [Myxococcales bacterium]
MSDAPRQGVGTFFRALLAFIDAKGLRDKVREAVSPETQKQIDDPPRPLAFIASTPIDEMETALHGLTDDATLVECGLACARPLGWSLLAPVLRVAFTLFGHSPSPVLANLNRFFSLVTRGISFEWTETEGKSGIVTATFQGSGTPDAAYHVLRGSLLFTFEACGIVGQVGVPQVQESTPSAAIVRYEVKWG